MDAGDDGVGGEQERPARRGQDGHVVTDPGLARGADQAVAQALDEGEFR